VWLDEVNPNDPSTKDIIPKNRVQKRVRNFVDKMADKNRLRRARHKGGHVPNRLKKI